MSFPDADVISRIESRYMEPIEQAHFEECASESDPMAECNCASLGDEYEDARKEMASDMAWDRLKEGGY